MTKEQVIAMARQVGADIDAGGDNSYEDVRFTLKELERFATLVGNAKLEKALNILKNHHDYTRREAVEAIESLKEPTT